MLNSQYKGVCFAASFGNMLIGGGKMMQSLIAQIGSMTWVDGKTGRPIVQYQLNGRNIAHVELEGRLAKRYAGLSLIQKDLGKAMRWAARATEIHAHNQEHLFMANNPDNIDEDPYLYFGQDDSDASDERQAFFIAALTFYGKAFTDAPVRGVKAETNWLDTGYRELHSKFMSLRHFLAAHAGDKESALPMVIIVPDEARGGFWPLINVRRHQTSYVVEENEGTLESLIAHVHDKVTNKIAETMERIFLHLIDVVGWPEILSAAASNKPLNLDLFKAKGPDAQHSP